MKRNASIFIILLLSGLMGATIWADARRDKARYYYLAASEQHANGKNAEAYDLYRHAMRLDPSYTEAATAVGSARLTMRVDSFQTLDGLFNSAALMKNYVAKYPADYEANLYYAYVMEQLGDMDEALVVYKNLDTLFPGKKDLLNRLADAYAQTEGIAAGIDVLNRLERIEGISPEISMRKMSYHLYDKDTVAALTEADVLIREHPKSPVGHLLKSSLYEMMNYPDSCRLELLAAEKIDPENGDIKLNLAKYYLHVGDSANYDKKMYEALVSESLSPEDKVESLASYLQSIISDSADTSRGDSLFRELDRQMAYEPSLIDLSSRYKAAKGDLQGAEEDALRVLNLTPDNVDIWFRLLSYYAVDEKYDEVLPAYHNARQVVKNEPALSGLAASIMLSAKRFDDALDVYGDVIKDIYPDLPLSDSIPSEQLAFIEDHLPPDELYILSSYYTLLGDVYQLKEEMPKAYQEYENALAIWPDNQLALNNYAYFLLTKEGGDTDKAYEMASRAIKIEPNNPTYLDTYAWALFKKQEYLQAKIYQSQAIENAQKEGNASSELYDHMGDILFFLNGNPDQSMQYWEEALKEEPDNETIKKKVEQKTYFNE